MGVHLGRTFRPAKIPTPSSGLRSLTWLSLSLPMSLRAKKERKYWRGGICLEPGSRAWETTSGNPSRSMRGANRKMPPILHYAVFPSKALGLSIWASWGTLTPATVSPIASLALLGTGGNPAFWSSLLIVRGLISYPSMAKMSAMR